MVDRAISTLEQIAPRIGKAHRERLDELRRTRPCGHLGFCDACYIQDEIDSGRIAWIRHEAAPWEYDIDDPRHAHRSYALVQYHSGFRTRVYDWQMKHAVRGW